MCMYDIFRNFYLSFLALLSPVHTISGSLLSTDYIFVYILLSSYYTFIIADQMNELCTRGDILPKGGDDESNDGRYFNFGVYIKVYMCDICNGFLDEFVQYELFVLLVFHRNEQTSVVHRMKCKSVFKFGQVGGRSTGRSIPPHTLSSDIGWPRVDITLQHIRWQINWEITLPVELN